MNKNSIAILNKKKNKDSVYAEAPYEESNARNANPLSQSLSMPMFFLRKCIEYVYPNVMAHSSVLLYISMSMLRNYPSTNHPLCQKN